MIRNDKYEKMHGLNKLNFKLTTVVTKKVFRIRLEALFEDYNRTHAKTEEKMFKESFVKVLLKCCSSRGLSAVCS